jgi:hypothetical protein
MDSGLNLRPNLGVAQSGYGRPEPLPARDAVATVLAPSQSVSQAANAAAARNDKDAARTPTEPSVSHDVVIDPATREIIYRMVDARSGQIISQVPDAMQLQIAAYTRAVQRGLEHGKTLTEAQAKADLEV